MPRSKPYIEISLDRLLYNLAAIRSRIPSGVKILAVVKDNAYGCGSRIIARTLETNGGVDFFAVSRPEEAFFLRREGIASPILVLGPAAQSDLKRGSEKNILFTLNDIDDIVRWKSAGVPVHFHCNIDTRMHRMGILPSEVEMLAYAVANSAHLRLEGLFTHLANADEPGTATVAQQLALFNGALSLLKSRGIVPRHVHYANSAGIIRFDLPGCTMVRPGIALYGCKPDPAQSFDLNLQPIVSLKTTVIKLKKVPQGTPISYGGRYSTNRETFIATLALGYAHGFPRSLANRGSVLIRGKRYTIAGAVTMDYVMIDAGPLPSFSIGDQAIAIGEQEGATISPDDIALLDRTIGYEVLCRLGASLDKRYIFNGRVVATEKSRLL